MIFVGIFALHEKAGLPLHCSQNSSGALQRLQNPAGRTLKALKLCGANLQSIFAQRNYGAFEVRPAESSSNATCAPLSHGDIAMLANISKKNPYFLGNFL